mgnify:CR=1 FL=1
MNICIRVFRMNRLRLFTEYSDYIARKSGYDEDMIGYVLNQGPGAEADQVIAGD